MSSALEKFKVGLRSQFGENSAMSPDEIPNRGVVSSGSLGIDYMIGSNRGMGIPRNIVIELAGEPGASKSSTSLSIVNAVLKKEFERACFRAKVKKLVKEKKFDPGEFDWFEKFYSRQEDDLHVWNEPEKNEAVDKEQLTEDEKQYVLEEEMRFAVYLDLEGRFDESWARHFIEDRFIKKLIVTWPDNAEIATDMYTDAVKNYPVAAVVFDSIGGAPSQRVTNKSAQSGNVGGNALAITRFAQFAETLSNKYCCLTIGINQVRADMSGYHQLITPGGVAWKHACSLRIELKRKARDVVWDVEPGTVDSTYICGYKITARLHKNSIGRSGQSCEFWFYTNDCRYGDAGFGTIQELINLAVLSGVIEKGAGGVYRSDYFDNGKIRGYDNMVAFIKERVDVSEELTKDMQNKLLNGGIEGATSSFETEDDESEEDDLV
jgi:RecA/RadA recombinase